jgi:hypothetical protein
MIKSTVGQQLPARLCAGARCNLRAPSTRRSQAASLRRSCSPATQTYLFGAWALQVNWWRCAWPLAAAAVVHWSSRLALVGAQAAAAPQPALATPAARSAVGISAHVSQPDVAPLPTVSKDPDSAVSCRKARYRPGPDQCRWRAVRSRPCCEYIAIARNTQRLDVGWRCSRHMTVPFVAAGPRAASGTRTPPWSARCQGGPAFPA